MRAGLEKGKLSFYLKGAKLEGSWTLVRLHGKVKEWLLIKHHDQFEDAQTDITEQDQSVVSGQTIESLQQNGSDRIWTSGGSKSADPETTGKSSRRKVTPARTGQSSRQTKSKAAPVDESDPHLKELISAGKKAAFPKEITPMLATLADAPFEQDGWFFEPKLDGVRAIAYVKNGTCHLNSRNQNDLTIKYPSVAQSLCGYDENYVFDGEVVALDDTGKPSFQHLQQGGRGLRSFDGKTNSEAILIYYVFDILHAQGKDLTNLPVTARKEILKKVLKTDDTVRLVQSLGGDGFAVFQACQENNLEGMVGKQGDSTYQPGARSRSWLKVKVSLTDEFLVCGYTEGTGSRRHTFGSLLLGENDDNGKLQYVGGVGTGFNDKKLNALLTQMKKLVTKTCPFKEKPKGKLNPIWLEPKLVAEVKYLERTQENILRAPVYMHLREDIEPANVKEAAIVHVADEVSKKASSVKARKGAATAKIVDETFESRRPKKNSNQHAADFSKNALWVLEQLDNDKEKLTLEVAQTIIPVTSLDKVFWPATDSAPAITKRDYIRYLAKVSDFVIPHLTDRLITLVRFPNGIQGMRFYQKHWEQGLPKFVKTARVFTEGEKKDQDFLVCNNISTLLWLGQIADLELHTSHTRIDQSPDATHLSLDMTGSVKALDDSIANYPDYIVLDLDPYLYSGKEKKDEEPELHRQGFENCREVAFILKSHLDSLKVDSFVKTSGKTGLHIYIPIKRNIDYDTVRTISEVICRQVLKEHPDKVTMEWKVKDRGGKIFLDHNMNARSKSLSSIYSVRVAPEACVSTPINWDELKDVYPTDFNTLTLPNRLLQVGDRWHDILEHKNDLKALFNRPVKPDK
jgi:bifunctional non-homologous end joining protein LigD